MNAIATACHIGIIPQRWRMKKENQMDSDIEIGIIVVGDSSPYALSADGAG